ncbi:MAG TPA: hypothetical protein VFD82_06765 [Planctomycetota bacterium]|nr:hypothetical protein [Planctomycetota bacterium]
MTALQCSLTIHMLDAKAAQGGQVDLAVQFLEWQRPDKQVRPLIRYRVIQAGNPIVRGRDQYGYWHLFQGEPKDLSGEFAEDLKAAERDTNLARQLIRFTDPGTVIRSLKNPGPVRDEILTLDRITKVPCWVVEGDLPAFPLLQQAGADAPVRLEIFVRKDKETLVAVEACPLVDGKKDPTRGERVHLLDFRERNDLLVPHELVHLFRTADGQLELKTKVTLIDLNLRPPLSVGDFDRKK